MAAEAINILQKKVVPKTLPPLKTQPKPVTPPPVKPQVTQNNPNSGLIRSGTTGAQKFATNNLIDMIDPSSPSKSSASPLTQKSVAPTPAPPTPSNTTPWNDTTGGFNKTYGSGLSDSVYQNAVKFLSNDYTDPDAQSKISQITANKYGLKTTTTSGIDLNPTSTEGILAAKKAKDEEDQSQLDKEVAIAAGKAKKNAETSISTINATTGAVNRAGMTSTGNKMAAGGAIGTINADLQNYMSSLADQKKQLSDAQAAGNTQLADQLGKNVASLQAVIQSHQLDQQKLADAQLGTVQKLMATGALSDATPEQIQYYVDLGETATNTMNNEVAEEVEDFAQDI